MPTSEPPTRTVSPLRPGDRVIVCGAGPAGLTAAYQLAQDGYAPLVLESDGVVGGLSRTVEYNGFRFDIGGHRFYTKVGRVQRMWTELLGEELIEVPRLSRIHYRGRYFDYPLKATKALFGLGPWEAVLTVASYLRARLGAPGPEENFEQWVIRRFGARLYRTFFKAYTEKVWGIPCTEIRAEWAAQRIQGLSLWRAVRAAVALNKRSTEIRSLIHTFQYPRLGPGQMWERCRDRVEAMGGQVLLDHRVIGVETTGGVVTGVRAATPQGVRVFPADHVISTIALRTLVDAFEPAPPPDVRAAASGIRYRDFLTVALVLDRADLFPDNWIYVHTPGVKVGRVQNFNNWSAAMVPEPGRTCLGLEYFCFQGDGLWASSDAELVGLAERELAALALAPGARVLDGTVVRMPKAYPVYDAEYQAHLGTLRAHLDAVPNLHTVGRNGMHKYNNQDHSMLTAMLAVENMLGVAAHDVWAVNTDYEHHEEQRVDVPRVPVRPSRRPAPIAAAVPAPDAALTAVR
jgi:protoporphyrinogen oxidase